MSKNQEVEYLENFVMSNPELDCLENLISEFNIFETLNLTYAEIRHSNFLGWLLDPSENHGLGSYFIKQFLKQIASSNKSYFSSIDISLFDFELFNYNNVEVRREWNAIDVLLVINENNKKVIVAIENKIKTSEHSNQLQRYKDIIKREKEFSNYIHLFIYLTPENITPSDEDWIPFNYDAIAELLYGLLEHKKSTLNPNIHFFISQYLTILRRYIVGNSEVEKIAIDIYKKHKQALDIIFQYKPDIYLEISEHIQTRLKEIDGIIIDGAGKTVIRFTTELLDAQIKKVSEGWTKSKRILLFEFDLYDTRLVLRLYIGPGEDTYRKKLIDSFLKNKSLFKLADRKFGTKWHAAFQKEIIQAKDFEEDNHDELYIKIDKKIDEFVKNDLVQIQEHFNHQWKE